MIKMYLNINVVLNDKKNITRRIKKKKLRTVLWELQFHYKSTSQLLI